MTPPRPKPEPTAAARHRPAVRERIGVELVIANIAEIVDALCVTPEVLKSLKRIEAKMSKLSDQIAALGESTDKAISRVQEDVTKLNEKATDLQAKLDEAIAKGNEPDPADVQALTDIKAKLDALDPTVDATLPEGGG